MAGRNLVSDGSLQPLTQFLMEDSCTVKGQHSLKDAESLGGENCFPTGVSLELERSWAEPFGASHHTWGTCAPPMTFESDREGESGAVDLACSFSESPRCVRKTALSEWDRSLISCFHLHPGEDLGECIEAHETFESANHMPGARDHMTAPTQIPVANVTDENKESPEIHVARIPGICVEAAEKHTIPSKESIISPEASSVLPDTEAPLWIGSFLDEMDALWEQPGAYVDYHGAGTAMEGKTLMQAMDAANAGEAESQERTWADDIEGLFNIPDSLEGPFSTPDSPFENEAQSEVDVLDQSVGEAGGHTGVRERDGQTRNQHSPPLSVDCGGNAAMAGAQFNDTTTCSIYLQGLMPGAPCSGGIDGGGKDVSGRGNMVAGKGMQEGQVAVGESFGPDRKRRRRAWERHKQTQEQKRGKASSKQGQGASAIALACGPPDKGQLVDAPVLISPCLEDTPRLSGGDYPVGGEQAEGDGGDSCTWLDAVGSVEGAGEERSGEGKPQSLEAAPPCSDESSGGTSGSAEESFPMADCVPIPQSKRTDKCTFGADKTIAGVEGRVNQCEAGRTDPSQFCRVEPNSRGESETVDVQWEGTNSQVSAPASEEGPAVSVWSPASSDPKNQKEGKQSGQDGRPPMARQVDASGGSGDDDSSKKLQRLIRNRASASESRLRKKSYVFELEGKCAALEVQLNSLRQLASITAMENGVLRDQLTRFQQYYGHYPGGVLPLARQPVVPPSAIAGWKGPVVGGSGAPAGGNRAPASEEALGEEQSGSSSGNPKSRAKGGDKAEPAALESDSLPSESLPRHSCPSQAVPMWAPLHTFLLLLSRGLCHLLVLLFLPLVLVLLNPVGGLPAVDSGVDLAQRRGSFELPSSATSDSLRRLRPDEETSGNDPGGGLKRGEKILNPFGPAKLSGKMVLSWIRWKYISWSLSRLKLKQKQTKLCEEPLVPYRSCDGYLFSLMHSCC